MTNKVVVFLIESSNENDYMYIKSFLDVYYDIKNDKLEKINLKGKERYNDLGVIKKIKNIEKKAGSRKLEIVCCLDFDNAINDHNIKLLNKKIEKYCSQNNYHLVWFASDIEEVFWGKKVSKNEKKDMAIRFAQNRNRMRIDLDNLRVLKPRNPKTSNICIVLDKLFTLKDIKD